MHSAEASPTVMADVPGIDDLLRRLGTAQVVVDCGCYGWRLAEACARYQHHLVGVDQVEPPNRPDGVTFASGSGATVAVVDDFANLTVASHILEHIQEPVPFLQELARITRPGGLVWLEAPSELSAVPRGSDCPADHSFGSFWDDPTHVRPWTPGALYRLALSCYLYPLGICRTNAGGIPSVRMLAIKPIDCKGRPTTVYVSLRDVDSGVSSAWQHVWRRPAVLPKGGAALSNQITVDGDLASEATG